MTPTKNKVITIVINAELDLAIERRAKKLGMLKRAVIADALRAYIEKPVKKES